MFGVTVQVSSNGLAFAAFLPAMAFGVLAVNKYYGYYQTWGAAINDFTNQGAVYVYAGDHLFANGFDQ